MADVNFLRKLMEFDKEHISESTLKKLKTYVEHDDFNPAVCQMPYKISGRHLIFFFFSEN